MFLRTDEALGQARPASTAGGNVQGSLVQRIRDAVHRGQDALAIALAVSHGVRDANEIANLVFWARHPTRWGQKLRRGEPNFQRLSQEWLGIRNRTESALSTLPSKLQRNAIPPAATSVPAAPEQRAFLERVLAAHKAHSFRTKGPALPDLSNDKLDTVAGTDIKMRKDAAMAAGRLLAAANHDLAAAKAVGDLDALKTLRISANSGYRNREYQERLWRQYFVKRYHPRTTSHRASLPGGAHGDAAVKYMVRYVSPKVAAPGFSRHQAGLAIDFLQHRTRGNEISNSTDTTWVKRWQNTWFFKWLQANAGHCRFTPYRREPWHWTYNPTA